MTKSVFRKTYTGITAKIKDVRITIDGSNVRIKVDDPSGEAYLTIDEFARIGRIMTRVAVDSTENIDGWMADEEAVRDIKTPLFSEGVRKARERIREEEKVPKFFRGSDTRVNDAEGEITVKEETGDDFLL